MRRRSPAGQLRERVRSLRRSREHQERLWTFKQAPCMDCGGTFPPECMDFDHRDPSQKEGDIGTMRGTTLDRLLAEIAKCDLVCANCHRIRTRRQGPIRRSRRLYGNVTH